MWDLQRLNASAATLHSRTRTQLTTSDLMPVLLTGAREYVTTAAQDAHDYS